MSSRKKILFLAAGLVLLASLVLFLEYVINFLFRAHHEEVKEEYVPTLLYGFNVDTMPYHTGIVRPNEFLSTILGKYGVDNVTIEKLVRETAEVFDVRKMRHGQSYTVIFTNDSIPRVRYFVYEINTTDYVVYGLLDSIYAWRGQKEMEIKTETIHGKIKTSLWNSILENNGDPNLALALSDIYAWTIDFFGIQKGDHYRIVYENVYVEGKPVGIGKVLAAQFHHMGRDFYSFYFVQNGVGDYFDQDGNSLRRAFLKAPLNYRRISSHFSHQRMHPVLKIVRPHHGVDYAAPEGTPVMSIGDGVVEYARWDPKGGGNMVRIKHNSIYSTAYLHLQRFASGIRGGVRVKQGQVIGYVGSTGVSTGPHLDFRVYKNGVPINPLKLESPPADPVKPAFRAQFESERDQWMKMLQSISGHPVATITGQ